MRFPTPEPTTTPPHHIPRARHHPARRTLALALLTLGFACGCGQQSSKPATPPAAESQSTGNPITAPVDYIGAVGKAQRSAERTVDLASLTRAIQMFQVQEDRLPRNLQELVSEGILHTLPQPPPQSEIAYDPRTGAVRIVPKRR